MPNFKTRLDKLAAQLPSDDDIIQIDYIRNWRAGDSKEVVMTKYFKPGVGVVRVVDNRSVEDAKPQSET